MCVELIKLGGDELLVTLILGRPLLLLHVVLVAGGVILTLIMKAAVRRL